MPPGPTAPRSLAGLLAEFRPCFTAPTFQTFVGLVVGLIAQTRRRTVCGMPHGGHRTRGPGGPVGDEGEALATLLHEYRQVA